MTDPQEPVERIAKGDKGDKGATGAAGKRGLPRAVAWSIFYLFLVTALLTVGGYAVLHAEITRAVQGNEQQRCESLRLEYTIPVPHPLAGNPSRIWEARFEAIQAHRARQLHCNGS